MDPRHSRTIETPALQTKRLSIDPICPPDAASLAVALSDPGLYHFIGGEPPSVEALAGRIQRWLAGPARAGEAWHNWAIRLASDGTVIGHLQATVTGAATGAGAAADIAWILAVRWQGRGYASEAAIQLVRWLGSMNVDDVTAHIHPDHVASARVAERAGLEPTDDVEDGERVWRRSARS